MRKEWQEFWYWTFRKSLNCLWTLPLSLFFFLANAPSMETGTYLRGYLLCVGFGLCISVGIWLTYTLFWTANVIIKIKTGRSYRPGLLANFLIGASGSMSGLYVALIWQAWMLGKQVSFTGLLPELALGLLICVGFLFFYAYLDAKRENDQLKVSSSEANYRALKNQMQPHFLFNSLNSLSQLIQSNQERASEMTQKLSDLYREILQNSKSKTAPLDTEISIARKYLELEKLRFGDRLHFSINESIESRSVYVPSLILQTLVENALKHGIAKQIEGGEVIVDTEKEEKGFRISIKNSGEIDANQPGDTGIGLANTRARLQLLYGSEHPFEFYSRNGETVASFIVSGEPID